MYLIDGQPYIDLTNEIDFDGFQAIENDINFGLAKSRAYFRDTGASVLNCYDKSIPSISDLMKKVVKPDFPNYEYYKKLGFNLTDCLAFAKYTDVYQSMGCSLQLRTFKQEAYSKPNHMAQKSDADAFYDNVCFDNFPSLKKWIENLKIFTETGRIVFFTNAPNESSSLHKDTFVGHVDNFILLNLHPERKTIFIYDEEHDAHLNIDSKAFVFDPRNWHGATSSSHSWTLRIDGKFDPDWARSLGIWEYFDTSTRIK